MGRVEPDGRLEQIKGVSYHLHQFLGQQWQTDCGGGDGGGGQDEVVEEGEGRGGGGGGRGLCYVTIYLSPGDYHGFHSPANWRAHTRRHFPGGPALEVTNFTNREFFGGKFIKNC